MKGLSVKYYFCYDSYGKGKKRIEEEKLLERNANN